MKKIKEVKRATKRTKDAQLTVRFSYKDILKSLIHRTSIFFAENNKGEVNLFAIVCLAVLGFMLIVLLIMF